MMISWFKSVTLKEKEAGLPKFPSKCTVLHDVTPQTGKLLIPLTAAAHKPDYSRQYCMILVLNLW